MQLRKRSSYVNYTENGSPPTTRSRRTNSAAADVAANSSDSEDEGPLDTTGEGSSGMEINDDIAEVRSANKRASKRKHGAGNDLGKENTILVYMKRNAGNGDPNSSPQGSEEEGDGDEGDDEEVKACKKRKLRAEARTRPLRARKSETVNYKDASSSDEGEEERISKGGRLDGGSSGKSSRGHHRSSSDLVVDGGGLPESSSMLSNRKRGDRNGKTRRIAAPAVESTDSLPLGKEPDGDSVKCYSRRLSTNAASDGDEGDEQSAGDNEKVPDGKSRGAGSSPDGSTCEPEGEENGAKDGRDSAAVDQQHGEASATALGTQKMMPSKTYVVDTFGLRIGCENDYGTITKRFSKVEKILAVRNRSTDAPIFCVKLLGQSYRNVVNVSEIQLQRHCPQLLRTFVKRMHALNRVDGHPGDHAMSPAFNPQHLKIDRIVFSEKHKRGTRYLVKWVGLPYSESTWERDEDLSDDVDAIKRHRAFNRRKKRVQLVSPSSKLVFKDGRSLRDYQEEGVSWLDDKWQNGVNCILADEMGLGKTIQSVAMMETLRLKHGIQGPFLVVAPVSTLGHWQREIESLTDMNCVVYSGNSDDREIIRDCEFKYDNDKKSSDVKFNVLLTSFEIMMKDQNKLIKISWQFVIVDEAHRLKSSVSKTTISLKQMGVPYGGLLLLTGTPVQNNTKEIFSLLNVLDAEKFDSEEDFLTKYGDLKNAEQVKDLQDNVLRPRLLRRMKEDVEKSIPQKEETIVWVELTREQRVYYRAIYENAVGVLLKGSQGNNIPSLRNVAMELRKVCNHPLLCDGIEDDLIAKHNSSKDRTDPHIVQKLLQNSSGKMVLVDKLLPMLKEAGNRVLIFSQFTMMLDLLEDYLNHKGYSYERIDGKIRGPERQAAIDRYSAKESDIFVFLLSTRAGGLGITLTAADTCLIYDSDWNPQNDLQAMARCHRIGQTKDVRIYRLITRNTYEQKLFECSSRKYGLDEAILGNRLGADADVEQTVNIESLLKHGAYDMVKEDGDAASAEFNNENIHEILAHRTQKRLIGGRGTNTFSVATFTSQSEMDTEANDDRTQRLEKGSEDFWQELLPEAYKASKTVVEKVSLSPLGSRRKRAQIRIDYRENAKAVSDDEFQPGSSSGRDSQSDESSVSVQSDEDEGITFWSEKEVKRLEDRLMVLGRNRSCQIQQEANLAHREVSEIDGVSDFLYQFCHFIENNKNTQNATTSVKSPDAHVAGQKPDGLVVDQTPDVHMVDQKHSVCTINQQPGVEVIDLTADVHATDQKPGAYIIDLKGDVHRVNSTSQDLGKPVAPGDPRDISNEIESVPDIWPLGCVIVNDVETAVNYRKDGCLLIGDTRRPTPPVYIRKSMKSSSLINRLSKNASRYLQILREREILARAIERNNPLYLPPRVPVRSKKIPSWWGTQEDLDLMIGVNKYGYREFKKVRMDPTLCFAKRKSSTDQTDGTSQANGHSVNGKEVVPSHTNPPSEDGAQNQDWPHESVLTARLKKLIQLLPSGSGAREVNRNIPKSHKKRPADTSRNAEKSGHIEAGVVPLKDLSSRAAVKDASARTAAAEGPSRVTVKEVSPRVTLKEASERATVKEASPRVVLKEVSARAPVKEVSTRVTVKNLSAGVAMKDKSHEAVPKVKDDTEVLHRKSETMNSAKESESSSRKPFSINVDKKEAVLDNGRQQRITGYFIPKLAVAT
ncbi:unnamed protein product [Calypogeia fissa]